MVRCEPSIATSGDVYLMLPSIRPVSICQYFPSLLAAGLLLGPGAARAEPAVDQAELLRKLRQKGLPLYAGYRGVASRRRVTTQERDPRTDKVEKTLTMEVAASEFFYLPLRRKILWCKVDGKPAQTKECEGRKGRKPTWPLFDRDGQKNYDITWVGQKKVHGVPCHKLKITPKRRTDRHLRGHLYVAVDSLDPVLLESTVADLPFPLERFYLKLRFKQFQGQPVVSRGYVDLEIKVPVFFHKRIVSRFVARAQRLIPR
jgi:hypothetical protein